MSSPGLTAVTGAAGHVGANLVRNLLDQGRAVRTVVHHDRRALEGLEVEQVEADVLDPDALKRIFRGVDVVYHLAATISVRRNSLAAIQDVNIRGVENVSRACLHCGVRRLVHFSSIHALSAEPEGEMIDESRPLVEGSAVLPYDWTKAEGERRLRAAVAEGLDAVVVRPTAILGPCDFKPSDMGRFFLAVYHERIPAVVPGGFNWVDVRDVVRGAIAAEQRGGRGMSYLLPGHWTTVKDLAALIGRQAGCRVTSLETPMWLARLGAPLASAWSRLRGREPLYTSGSLKTLQHHRYISGAKAEAELSYRPRPLEDTVRDTFEWFRDHSDRL